MRFSVEFNNMYLEHSTVFGLYGNFPRKFTNHSVHVLAVTFAVDSFVSHWTTTFVSCPAHRLNAGPSILTWILQTLTLRYCKEVKKGNLWTITQDINWLNPCWISIGMFCQIIKVPNRKFGELRVKVGLVDKLDVGKREWSIVFLTYVFILQDLFLLPRVIFINGIEQRH